MKREDMVALFYTLNVNYTEVKEADSVEGLCIDGESETWSYKSWDSIPLGESRNPYHDGMRVCQGIIGVYDRTDLCHLNAMTRDARDFTEEDSPYVD